MTTDVTAGIDVFAEARAVADAVLFEGYVLYPYRASARKNRIRWQFGVLVPPSYAPDSGERSGARTQFLLQPGDATHVRLRLRFLQVQRRTVYDATGTAVESLVVDGIEHVSWDEAEVVELDRELDLDGGRQEWPFTVEGSGQDEQLRDPAGRVAGSVRRRRAPLTGTLAAAAEPVAAGALLVTVEVANTDSSVAATREDALAVSLIGAHVLASASGGTLVSMTDPPAALAAIAAAAQHDGLWPVLIGTEPAATVLAAPIILYDQASVAPESPGELFDGLEIDEILTLRTMTLTDAEKAEARATDPRAAALVDRIDGMPPEILERLHGAIRALDPVVPAADRADEAMTADVPWWDPASDGSVDPLTETVDVGGRTIRAGDRVELHPHRMGSDAQDLFLVGRAATVHAVHEDVDGARYLAVTIDGDPATELHLAHGRFLYFKPHEVVPLDGPA